MLFTIGLSERARSQEVKHMKQFLWNVELEWPMHRMHPTLRHLGLRIFTSKMIKNGAALAPGAVRSRARASATSACNRAWSTVAGTQRTQLWSKGFQEETLLEIACCLQAASRQLPGLQASISPESHAMKDSAGSVALNGRTRTRRTNIRSRYMLKKK